MFLKNKILLIILFIVASFAGYFIISNFSIVKILWLSLGPPITQLKVKENELWMNKEINVRTYKQFIRVLERNPQVDTIVLEHSRGSYNDDTMIELAYFFRESGLKTKLIPSSDIASGAVDLFLSGVERIIQIDGNKIPSVGVHSWLDPTTGEEARYLPADHPGHLNNKKYIEEMLGRDEFYWYTINAADAEEMLIMDLHSLSKYNIFTSLEFLGEDNNPKAESLLNMVRNSVIDISHNLFENDDAEDHTTTKLTDGHSKFSLVDKDLNNGVSDLNSYGTLYIWPFPFELIETGNKKELIAIISIDSGGSGVFYYLSLFDVSSTDMILLATEFLGDRIIVEEISSKPSNELNYNFIVNYYDRKIDESFVEKPTVPKKMEFRINDGVIEIISK